MEKSRIELQLQKLVAFLDSYVGSHLPHYSIFESILGITIPLSDPLAKDLNLALPLEMVDSVMGKFQKYTRLLNFYLNGFV